MIRADDPSSMLAARFGVLEKARADDIVLVVGNPFGLSGSVTEGVISATGRAVTGPAPRARPGRSAERGRIVAVTSGEPADKGRAAGRGT